MGKIGCDPGSCCSGLGCGNIAIRRPVKPPAAYEIRHELPVRSWYLHASSIDGEGVPRIRQRKQKGHRLTSTIDQISRFGTRETSRLYEKSLPTLSFVLFVPSDIRASNYLAQDRTLNRNSTVSSMSAEIIRLSPLRSMKSHQLSLIHH